MLESWLHSSSFGATFHSRRKFNILSQDFIIRAYLEFIVINDIIFLLIIFLMSLNVGSQFFCPHNLVFFLCISFLIFRHICRSEKQTQTHKTIKESAEKLQGKYKQNMEKLFFVLFSVPSRDAYAILSHYVLFCQ